MFFLHVVSTLCLDMCPEFSMYLVLGSLCVTTCKNMNGKQPWNVYHHNSCLVLYSLSHWMTSFWCYLVFLQDWTQDEAVLEELTQKVAQEHRTHRWAWHVKIQLFFFSFHLSSTSLYFHSSPVPCSGIPAYLHVTVMLHLAGYIVCYKRLSASCAHKMAKELNPK